MGGFMKEFLTIGELANIFNMDVQLLRHYDTKGLLVPQVRNSENNRRFYHSIRSIPWPRSDTCGDWTTPLPRSRLFSTATVFVITCKCSPSRRSSCAVNAMS